MRETRFAEYFCIIGDIVMSDVALMFLLLFLGNILLSKIDSLGFKAHIYRVSGVGDGYN